MTTRIEIRQITVEGKGFCRFENEQVILVKLSNGEEMTTRQCFSIIGNEGICGWIEVENMKKRALSSKLKFIAKHENELVNYTKTYLN